MRFFKLYESVSKDCKDVVKFKAEYFWHYWEFLFTENRNLILVNDPKFVSQISLINKVQKHLEWNNGVSSKKLLKYFNHHIYFNKSNLILRCNPDLSKEILRIKNLIESSKTDDESKKYLKDKDRLSLLEAFGNLQTSFYTLEDYSGILLSKLVKTIANKRRLNEPVRQDLKFLCNSIVDLLVLRGYSLIFIKGLLSNTIFTSSNKFNFSYPKRYIDFDNDHDAWSNYAKEQLKKLSLIDRLNYLKKFLVQAHREGFFIFKVEGIDFQSEPIEVFESKFYNPNRDSFLSFYNSKNKSVSDDENKYYKDCELFVLNKPENQYSSGCNLIVPIKYFTEDIEYFDSFKFPAKSFIQAKINAKISILQFRRYLKSYSTEHFFDEGLNEIRLTNESILVDKEYNYHTTSNSHKLKRIVFKLDEIREDMLTNQLDYRRNIKSKNYFLKHLANSNVVLSEMTLENHKFNFKSLWIECIEPYFNDIDDFINYAQKSIRIRINFFSNYRILLNNALRCNGAFCRSYCLGNEKMNEIGISDLKIGDIVYGDDLEKKFESLPFDSMLYEFKKEMKLYTNSHMIFLKKIDDWIDKIVRISYDERNIEVHNNIVDYYNDISVKKDVSFICSVVIGSFNDAVSISNVESIIAAKDYIDKTLEDLMSN